VHRRLRGLVVPLLAGLLGATTLAGCSDDPPASSDGSSAAPSASPTTGAPSESIGEPGGESTDAGTGRVLTEPGTDLTLGEGATVSWQPRQGVVGTLWISVDRVVPTTFKQSFRDWRVDEKTRTSTPYFVYARVANLGDTDLGRVGVPLYGESAADALVEPATFKETFEPCHPSALPRRFPPRATTSVCLVYLVPQHGQLEGAAFRPAQEFAPIVWRPAAPTTSPTTSPSTSPTGSPTP
jgi:hypothetical protein